MSTRGLALHAQTIGGQSSAAEQELQDPHSTSISGPQHFIPQSTSQQAAQIQSDTFAIAKHHHGSHGASLDGPALPLTTAASSIVYNSIPRVDQSSIIGASELDAPLNVAGFNSVEKTRLRTTPTEATHDYSETDSSDASTLSYIPPWSRGYPRLGPIDSRIENEYMVCDRFAVVANKLIHG